MQLPGTVGMPALGADSGGGLRQGEMRAGSGCASLSSVRRVASVGWGGGEVAVGAAGQLPAPLMDRPMVGSAHQGQIGQVGGAAIDPVPQVVALTPGDGPGAVGEHTAPVADGQGGALGRGDDSAGPPDIQRLGRRAPEHWREPVHGRPQPSRQPCWPALGSGERSDLDPRTGGGLLVVVGVVGVAGVAGDDPPGDRPVASQPPARLGAQGAGPAGLPAEGAGVAEEAVEVDDHIQLGADPAGLGELACLQVAAGQLGQGVGAALVAAAGIVGGGRAGQGVQGRGQGLAGLRLQQPLEGDHAVHGVAHQTPRRPWRRSPWWSAASGSVAWTRWPTARRSRGGSRCRAAATSTGSAWAVTWVGRWWVPWASALAWAADSSPSHSAWAVAVRGPRNNARAVRTALLAALAPSRSRPRSQLAVEAAWMPWSAPAAPRPSTAARRWSHWPSRRSTSRRNPRACSARAASASPSRSWAASPSTTSASGPSPCGNLSEHLFESMAATYQAPTPKQAPNQICGQVSGLVVGLHARLLVLAARLWQNHASALDGLARARSTWGVGLPRSWSIAATLSPRRRSGPLPSATTWCAARTGRSRSRPGGGNRLIWPSRCGTRRGSRRWCSCLFRKPRWSRTACTWTCGRLACPMRRRWSG